MKKEMERRRHIRAPISLKAILTTPEGTFEGKTADISESGLAVILFLEKPEVDDTFELVLESSEDHQMKLMCTKVWSGKIVSDETIYNAIGVEFIKISPSDQKIIGELVEKFFLV